MKWFRHESRANADAKLQKLLIKYGFQGYGLYWFCVEQICAALEPKLTFELETDSEILAHVGRMDSRLVEEIMLYIIKLELFEQRSDVITCLKLARFLGENATRNKGLKQIIRNAKTSETVSDSHIPSQTVDDSHILSEIVTDCHPEIREDKNKTYAQNEFAQFDEFWEAYRKKKNRAQAEKAWAKLSELDRRKAIADVTVRATKDPAWLKENRQFQPYASTYLNGRMWEDEWDAGDPEDPDGLWGMVE